MLEAGRARGIKDLRAYNAIFWVRDAMPAGCMLPCPLSVPDMSDEAVLRARGKYIQVSLVF